MMEKFDPHNARILECHGLSAWYGKHPVLDGVDLTVPTGSVTCLTGPSGSGKSTLLSLLVRLDEEKEELEWKGRIRFHGQDLDGVSDLPALRRKIVLVDQKPTVFPGSVERNVLFGVRERMKKRERKERAAHYLQKAQLHEEVADRFDMDASKLSVGQQQRLCIARALAVEPEVLILDEPTSSLDRDSCRSIEAMMAGLAQERSILFVTHDLEQAKRIGDHQVVLEKGRCRSGEQEELGRKAIGRDGVLKNMK